MHGEGGPDLSGFTKADCSWDQALQEKIAQQAEEKTAEQQLATPEAPSVDIMDRVARMREAAARISTASTVERPQMPPAEDSTGKDKEAEATVKKAAEAAKKEAEEKAQRRDEIKPLFEKPVLTISEQEPELVVAEVTKPIVEPVVEPTFATEIIAKIVDEAALEAERPEAAEPTSRVPIAELVGVNHKHDTQGITTEINEQIKPEVISLPPVVPIIEQTLSAEPAAEIIETEVFEEDNIEVSDKLFDTELVLVIEAAEDVDVLAVATEAENSLEGIDVMAVHEELLDLISLENETEPEHGAMPTIFESDVDDEVSPVVMSMAEIVEAAPEQPLEQTLGQLKTHIELTPSDEIADNEVVLAIRDLVDTVKELQLLSADEGEKYIITPEVTEKLLTVIQKLGYDKPDKVLMEFVQVRGFRELMDAMFVLAEAKQRLVETPETKAGLQLQLGVLDDNDTAVIIPVSSYDQYEGNVVGNLVFRAAMIKPAFELAA